jgi:single-stranded-DNA-specific exonuclease
VREARGLLCSVDHVVPHTDTDGLAAGAIALRARARRERRARRPPRRGDTPFGIDPPLPNGSVALLDFSARALAWPRLIVDHHVPEAEPRQDQVVVSA